MNSMKEVTALANNGKKFRASVAMLDSLRHLKLKVLGPLIQGVMREGSYEALGRLMRGVITIGVTHFVGSYKFDLGRLERCDIRYAVLYGRILPFSL